MALRERGDQLREIKRIYERKVTEKEEEGTKAGVYFKAAKAIKLFYRAVTVKSSCDYWKCLNPQHKIMCPNDVCFKCLKNVWFVRKSRTYSPATLSMKHVFDH